VADWMDLYLSGDLGVIEPQVQGPIGAADPVLVVGAVLGLLEARGVPVVVEHSIDCAVEAAERLLRCLGVEATNPWTVTPCTG
jgi:hypothetical protein